MIYALIHSPTGSVIEWGAVQYRPEINQSVVEIVDASSFPEGVENRYVKVVSGLFVAMDETDRVAVNLVIPQRQTQRVEHVGDVMVSTRETDPGDGWGDVIPLTTAQPLLEGAYQLVCGFELALVVPSLVHTAQAVLELSGVEIATFNNPRQAFNRCQYVDTFTFETGDRPTVRLRIRRFGPVAGTARARRASIVIYPAVRIRAEL